MRIKMNIFKHFAKTKLCFLIPVIIQKYVAVVVVVVAVGASVGVAARTR
jgi:hypothetical protein